MTHAGPGDAFHDIEATFAQTVARGYDTVRVDAMPLLMFDTDGRPRDQLRFAPWPGGRGEHIRWYDQRSAASIRPVEALRRLFGEARRAGCRVIASSWEFQQTLSFLAEPALAEEILAIPTGERFEALGRGMDALVSFLRREELLDALDYVELHNEVNASMFTAGTEDVIGLHDMRHVLERVLAGLQDRHPDVQFTVCYTEIRPDQLDALPENLQVMHQHIYDWSLVELLEHEAGTADGRYPTPIARSLWRADAPTLEDYSWPPEQAWRARANVAANVEFFHLHHSVDPERFDAWLLSRWQEHRASILRSIQMRLETYALEAARRGIPAVIGEGWIGWWPAESRFEVSAAAREVIRRATAWARDLGYEGAVLSSNYAPQHPEWADAEWQRAVNEELRAGGSGGSS